MRQRLPCLVVLVTVTLAAATASPQTPEDLFVTLGRQGDLHATRSPIQSQLRVGMRIDRLFSPSGTARARVHLTAGDHTWSARFERLDYDAANGFRSWVGALEGVRYSHVVFTEKNGVVSGLINAVTISYQVRTIEPGAYLLEELDLARAGAELEPIRDPPALSRAATEGRATLDDGSSIDVLMLFTPNARLAAGGTTQVQAIASRVISDTNTIFGRSGIVTRVRLVGVIELAQVEAPAFQADLLTLSNSAVARALRDSSGADLVQLLVSSPDLTNCGIAYQFGFLASDFEAYSVADIACLGQYSPTHEMAHNLGSQHAPEDDAFGGLFPYSYGFKDPVRGFRTVMAYPCSGASCPRIPNFSNPTVTHGGAATGTSTQNNSLSINNAAATVSNFRPSVSGNAAPAAPFGLAAGSSATLVTLSWQVLPTSPVPASFIIEVGTAPTVSDVGSFDTGSNALSVLATRPARGVYFVRLRARNGYGISPPSNEVVVTGEGGYCTQAPGPPSNLSANVVGSTVMLTWTYSPSVEPITGTVVEAGSSPGIANLVRIPLAPTPAFSATAPPGTYYVRVRATNACGPSGASNEVRIVVP